MWNKDDMARINAHVDDHDLEEEVYDLPSGGVARVERMHDAGGDSWVIYHWGSRDEYDLDARLDRHDLCTVSLAFDTYMDAAEEIERDMQANVRGDGS